MAINKMSVVFGSFRYLYRCRRYNIFYFQKENFSVTPVVAKDMTHQPVQYSKTKASKLTANEIFFPKPNPAVLDAERFVIVGCLAVFLIYFCILREENKIDEILAGTFNYEGDEELKLVNAIVHARLKGFKTDDLEEKLKQIRGQK